MKITYDPNKNQKNIEERGLSFDLVALLDWNTAIIWQDCRFNYPETRYSMLALLDERLHFANFTPIPQGIRVISFRKANKREVKRYEIKYP
ncbi:BrnT family toxin [Pasteurella oralis]|uniref:BrnT family toxin n=1 Tax=Pasteurella oralis TaxID=1071947 RepID=UPI000C7C54CF|nr:BrnT family toxin [Pasteurella oralis]